jgi:hypothetical protein
VGRGDAEAAAGLHACAPGLESEGRLADTELLALAHGIFFGGIRRGFLLPKTGHADPQQGY